MSDKTGIEWTDATWNPVTGCTKVSPGCDHCYAESVAHRFAGTPSYPNGFGVTLRPERLDQPLRWRKPRKVFVNSMSDLFHADIPDDYIARVFAVMALAQQHTFQILTKRHARMRSLLSSPKHWKAVGVAMSDLLGTYTQIDDARALPNVWLGVSVENQQWADIRIPALLDTPAAVRFLSCEPLLGPVDLAGSGTQQTYWLTGRPSWGAPEPGPMQLQSIEAGPSIDWVIVGGESGPGARPMHPDWARTIRDQCAVAGVPFLFKQRGEWTWNEPGEFRMPAMPYTDRTAVMHPAGMTALRKGNEFDPFKVGHPNWTTRIDRVGKKRAGRLLDGKQHDGYPSAQERS